MQRALGQELSKLDDTSMLIEALPEPSPVDFKPESFDEEDDLTVADDDSDEKTEAGLEVLANDSPLVARVNKILIGAVSMGASDIHIEPQEKELLVRVRVNGSLQKFCSMPTSIHSRLAARVKIMANLVITERRHPQDGQIRTIIRGRKVEFRVSTIPGLHGEKIVLRVLGGGKIKDSVAELGLNARDLDCVSQAIRLPHGLILVTGPTGSGKSTTLYTMIKVLNRPDVNIVTAEDPVEYEMPGITQIPVRAKIGLTFESVLRSFLRQDPDIMLIGEIRDLETAEIAVKASITGHVVFSTKTLCSSCRAPAKLEDDQKRLLTESELARLSASFSPKGCVECQETGYRGRVPLFEVMPLRTSEMRKRVLSGAGAEEISEQAVAEGMTSLRQSALNAVAEGRTSFAEAFKVIAAE